ncbi:MAG: glycoside hydrolase family 2 protein [Lachnospiraceae bacterium]|jgi:beta-mannosidase|nr:glycoside hydrolase family 2 protein [Lachnospiraceae bacterium]
MIRESLNGSWNLRIIGDNIFGVSEDLIETFIPGSLYGALLAKGLMPDPHYRDNELSALKLMDNDFEFSRTFFISEEMLGGDSLILRFDGIDTLADIFINDRWVRTDGVFHADEAAGENLYCAEKIYSANNMHRIWEYDLLSLMRKGGGKGFVSTGENELRIRFYSPVKYIRNENAKVYAGGSWDAMLGYPHLRKTHCMFGWDWGPRLPDGGIFRDVSLISYHDARIDSVYIRQTHGTDEVSLDFAVAVAALSGKGYDIEVTVYPPRAENTDKEAQAADDPAAAVASFSLTIDDSVMMASSSAYHPQTICQHQHNFSLTITEPLLWWPRGYGEQPLYTINVDLLPLSSAISPLDSWKRRIGLRTMTVNTEPDEWGSGFAHQINGVKIFAKGANYIPEDNILSRINKERTASLLADAACAHHNIVRIWGGGYYPDSYFFDLCDELGLLVWQDFMFACACYELTDDFAANVAAEVRDNVRRLRHHASLAIWCGNNEMEEQMIHRSWRPSIKQKYDYIKMFEYMIPQILKEEDPATFYWPSSPSSGGNYDEPSAENRGDTHYWGVWHGNEPFTAFRDHYFRYLSEFGFQSFPAYATIATFTEEKDRNIFSYVMEMHQRNSSANGKIMMYISATYLYPTAFTDLIYASQLLQADAIRYAIEHNRRHRGRSMGTVIWQLNDIWPVASWAGIDYFGRWKALHYYEKRAFAPLMISCHENGEMNMRPYPIAEPAPFEKSARLHVANETMTAINGTVHWSLRDYDSTVIFSGSADVTVPSLDGIWLEQMDLADYNEREVHLSFHFTVAGKTVSSGSSLFTPPKYYQFADPALTYTRDGNLITVKSVAFAKSVEIFTSGGDIWLSDNFFDMEAGEKTVEILRTKQDLPGHESSDTPLEIWLRSVYDIGKDK